MRRLLTDLVAQRGQAFRVTRDDQDIEALFRELERKLASNALRRASNDGPRALSCAILLQLDVKERVSHAKPSCARRKKAALVDRCTHVGTREHKCLQQDAKEFCEELCERQGSKGQQPRRYVWMVRDCRNHGRHVSHARGKTAAVTPHDGSPMTCDDATG